MTIESVDTNKETAQLNMMKVIWLGLLFYPGVLVFVAFKVLALKEIIDTPLEIVFQLIAVGLLIASRVLPKILNTRNAKLQKQKNDLEAIKACFAGFIIALSLSESVVILGFVTVTLTGNPNKILPFALAGILNILLLYPRKEKILGTNNRLT